jgi:hypothetical protein
MRIPNSEFTERPWRIHEFVGDFEVEDVWSLPTPGGPGDLGRFARGFSSPSPSGTSYQATNLLFAIRRRLGTIFDWDNEETGVMNRVASLRERLPKDLQNGDRGPDFTDVPFRSVYLTDTEWVSEIANRTVHALMHVGWAEDGKGGGYHGQMTVLVKPNGAFGTLYMAGIKPIRHTIVYPQLIRSIGKNWPQYV